MGQGKSQFTEEELQDYQVCIEYLIYSVILLTIKIKKFFRILHILQKMKFCSKYRTRQLYDVNIIMFYNLIQKYF